MSVWARNMRWWFVALLTRAGNIGARVIMFTWSAIGISWPWIEGTPQFLWIKISATHRDVSLVLGLKIRDDASWNHPFNYYAQELRTLSGKFIRTKFNNPRTRDSEHVRKVIALCFTSLHRIVTYKSYSKYSISNSFNILTASSHPWIYNDSSSSKKQFTGSKVP